MITAQCVCVYIYMMMKTLNILSISIHRERERERAQLSFNHLPRLSDLSFLVVGNLGEIQERLGNMNGYHT